MLEQSFTQHIQNAPDLSNLPHETLNGSIGEMTIYKENLTQQQAEQRYSQFAEKDELFWKSCRETYYTTYNEELCQ